jgi:hypothetical protein
MWVRAHSQDDEQVSQDGDQVYGQKQTVEEGFHIWIRCQSQKKEFWNTCLFLVSILTMKLMEML